MSDTHCSVTLMTLSPSCVTERPASLKLADRGSFQTIGIITDVGLFLKLLADELMPLDVPRGDAFPAV